MDEDKIREITRGDNASDLYFNNDMLSGDAPTISGDRMLATGVNSSLLQVKCFMIFNIHSLFNIPSLILYCSRMPPQREAGV